MTIWKLAKILWVGAMTSLVLFQANADEIDDALKAGRTAEITRTEEEKQAARRALENAKRRIQEEVAALDDQPEDMEPENLLGEINALENLKTKLKQELNSLRESAPPPAVKPAPQVEPKTAPKPVFAGDPDLDAFKADINRQIGQWREQDLKNQLEQRAAISREQKELQKSFEKMITDLRSDVADEVARQTSALEPQGQGATKEDLENLLAKVDERLLTLKSGVSDPEGLSTEIEKAVQRATAGITKNVAILRDGLTKAQVEIKMVQATDPLTEDVAALKEGLDNTQAQLREIQGLAAISQDDQVALVNYRKSLKNDILTIRSELRDQLQSEIGAIAKTIEEEKAERNAAMAQQSEQLANLEKSLSKQIAESLGASSPSAETESVVAAVRTENKGLREDWAEVRQSLTQFKTTEEQARAQHLKKMEFTLTQHINDMDRRLASLESAPIEVASVASTGQTPVIAPAPVFVDEAKKWVDVEPKPVIETAPPAAAIRVSPEWTEESQQQRSDLEEVRERLLTSLKEYKAETDAEQRVEMEVSRQARLNEQARREDALRKKIGANPEAAGKGDRLEEGGESSVRVGQAARMEAVERVPEASGEPVLIKDDGTKKNGLFDWLRHSPEGKTIEELLLAEEEPEEIADVSQEVNGDEAAPLRSGGEGAMVRGLRGAVDTRMSAIGLELDQHPIFDLEQVDVAPDQGPRAEARGMGNWKYEGAWAKGRMNGPGTLTYPDGRVYSGQWRMGIRQGRGELVHPDGWTFEGEWGEGLINGEGSLSYTDNWSYSGSWKKGKMHGQGVLRHPDGWTYSGGWKDGRMSNEGALSYGDGWTYEGSWQKGKRSGIGTLTHPDGWQYAGAWRAGKRSGKGTLIFSDGWTYDGEWAGGTMNGTGTLKHPYGWAYEGEWVDGEMAGAGKIILQN